MNIPTILCPIDYANDTIEKVSSIASKEEDRYGHSHGVPDSVFSCPPRPESVLDNSPHWLLRYYPFSVGVLIFFIWLVLAIIRGFLTSNFSQANFFPGDYVEDPLFVVSVIIGGLIAIFLGLQKMKRRKTDNQPYLIELQAWETAVKRWERLYYCHHHKIVFDPETRKTCEPVNIKDFIYEKS